MAKKKNTQPETAGPVVEMVKVASLVLNTKNARQHPVSQIAELQASFESFGITKPILIDEANNVIVGNGRVEAAIKKGVDELPCVRVPDWSDMKKRSFAIAENRLGELSHFDAAILQASVGESEVLQRLFPKGKQEVAPPKKDKTQPVGDQSRFLSIGRTSIEMTEKEQQTLLALLRYYVAKHSVTNGFWNWLIAELKNA
jgi:hypothetical protein